MKAKIRFNKMEILGVINGSVGIAPKKVSYYIVIIVAYFICSSPTVPDMPDMHTH